MSQLLSLCPEILIGIFRDLDPEDLASLSKTCQLLYLFIKNDRLLWRELYLRDYDHILIKPGQPEPCWQRELQKLVALKKLLQSNDTDVQRAHLTEVANTAIDLLDATSTSSSRESRNVIFLAKLFERQINVDTFLCSSSLFQHAGPAWSTPAPTEAERQLGAKLHVLYGRSVEPSSPDARPVHTYARSRVYDLRRYKLGNMWGPFMDDGSGAVDWEKVQCVMVVLGHNLRSFAERTHGHFDSRRDRAFLGTAPHSFTSAPSCPSHAAMVVKEPPPPLAAHDPYGVTGTWRRVVCFLDYTDLYAFNFEPILPDDQEHDPIDTREAIRLITLKIRVSSIEDATGPDEMPGTKVVHFNGTSRSMHTSWDPNANSRIRGSVRTTREGAIRWTSFSIYHGEERWRSEGVQIGGIRSARGILGTWFDKDYNRHGPAGPTGFWKLSDEIEVEKFQHPIFAWV